MTKTPSINKINIVIPKKDDNSPIKKNKDELLENLKEITPDQLGNIAEEMRVARERREKENESEIFRKYKDKVYEFWKKIDSRKPQNLMRFWRDDSKVTENWERVWIVLLYDYTRDYYDSYSDPERWKKLFIKVWDYETSKEIVYVYPKGNPSNDPWRKNYDKIHRLEIQWDVLKVWLRKCDALPELYEISIPRTFEKKEKIYLSNEQKNEFKKRIESEKELLLKMNTKDEKYPNVFWYWARQIPNLPVSEIPFDKAIITDEYIDMECWEAYIVIKTQIDADSVKWKQYSWKKFRFRASNNGFDTKLIEEINVWEEEQTNGRLVSLNAMD